MKPNTRQSMLSLAKRIANTEYKDRIEKIRSGSTLSEYIIPRKIVREDEIRGTLKFHPEFDESEFRKMIKELETKAKQQERMFW